jgi:hypothetical protein
MKIRLAVFALFAALAANAMAAEWTGYIADEKCVSAKDAKTLASASHASCAAACIKAGSPAVLVTEDGKVYKIADQNKVTDHAGQKVTISGKMENGQIKVDSVKM